MRVINKGEEGQRAGGIKTGSAKPDKRRKEDRKYEARTQTVIQEVKNKPQQVDGDDHKEAQKYQNAKFKTTLF